jgi:hypothetical protein
VLTLLHSLLYYSFFSSLLFLIVFLLPPPPPPPHHHHHSRRRSNFLVRLFLWPTIWVLPWLSIMFPKPYCDLGSEFLAGGSVLHKVDDWQDSRSLLWFRMGHLLSSVQTGYHSSNLLIKTCITWPILYYRGFHFTLYRLRYLRNQTIEIIDV